jgi:hypothetical protein
LQSAKRTLKLRHRVGHLGTDAHERDTVFDSGQAQCALHTLIMCGMQQCSSMVFTGPKQEEHAADQFQPPGTQRNTAAICNAAGAGQHARSAALNAMLRMSAQRYICNRTSM